MKHTEYAFPSHFAPAIGGMSLRDYFAAAAMQGMLANKNRSFSAETCYTYADAMLKERAK